VTNEPNVECENVTNEPNVECENVTNEPAFAADVGLESPTYMKAPDQNSTNESNAGRRSRRDWHANGKPADRSQTRAARTTLRTPGTNAARTVGDSAERVHAGSGLTIVEQQNHPMGTVELHEVFPEAPPRFTSRAPIRPVPGGR
jgi:hypothetical protein